MKLPLFQVDAFAAEIFSGNPAAIVPLHEWLPADTMQKIAMENQLSETAFFVEEDRGFHLRWFTPVTEVDLCGHATLASAHVLLSELGHLGESVIFHTRSGPLEVKRSRLGYEMDFPSDLPTPNPDLIGTLSDALGATVTKALCGREDIVAIVDTEETVAALDPHLRAISELDARGVLVSAPGNEVDFVSRCFFPRFGIDEDPVTGSAHTTLGPYWAKQLGKSDLHAHQISKRRGDIRCSVSRDRVALTGEAVTFLRGDLYLP